MDVLLNAIQSEYGLKETGVATPFKDIPVGNYFHDYEGDVFKKISKGKIRPLGKTTEIIYRKSTSIVFDLGENL